MIYIYIGDGDSRMISHFIWPDGLIDQMKIPMKYNGIFLHFYVYYKNIYMDSNSFLD